MSENTLLEGKIVSEKEQLPVGQETPKKEVKLAKVDADIMKSIKNGNGAFLYKDPAGLLYGIQAPVRNPVDIYRICKLVEKNWENIKGQTEDINCGS